MMTSIRAATIFSFLEFIRAATIDFNNRDYDRRGGPPREMYGGSGSSGGGGNPFAPRGGPMGGRGGQTPFGPRGPMFMRGGPRGGPPHLGGPG